MALEFTLNHVAPAAATVDCLVVGAYADHTLTPAAQALDAGRELAPVYNLGSGSGLSVREIEQARALFGACLDDLFPAASA